MKKAPIGYTYDGGKLRPQDTAEYYGQMADDWKWIRVKVICAKRKLLLFVGEDPMGDINDTEIIICRTITIARKSWLHRMHKEDLLRRIMQSAQKLKAATDKRLSRATLQQTIKGIDQ